MPLYPVPQNHKLRYLLRPPAPNHPLAISLDAVSPYTGTNVKNEVFSCGKFSNS